MILSPFAMTAIRLTRISDKCENYCLGDEIMLKLLLTAVKHDNDTKLHQEFIVYDGFVVVAS
jgi:hypothetical protein